LAAYRDRPDVVFRSGDPAPTFASASVCVVPSIEDGFAYVVLEALASGCPVIVSRNVGGQDAVQDGENGFLIPVRDADSIRDRLLTLHASPRLLNSMSLAARASAEAYSLETERDALLAAFSNFLH
jgi:glycosyltransferase involved in cell wall biosynthesis